MPVRAGRECLSGPFLVSRLPKRHPLTSNMRTLQHAILVIAGMVVAIAAHAQSLDLADSALVSAFQRDGGKLLCAGKGGSLKEMRETFDPYIKDIDISSPASYSALAVAVYTAFPCPFSPNRPELRPARKDDIQGTWLVPDASGKFRYGPKSPSWTATPGVPPIKCEGVSFHETGEYRVAQVRGAFACPDFSQMQTMRSLPRVSSWGLLPNGRVKISRTDVPAHFEEWEVFLVQIPFEFFGVQFTSGDLLAYLRREPGNEINAVTTFRHLQGLK